MREADLDPILLSREFSRIQERKSSWEDRLRENPTFEDAPLQMYRELLGLGTFESLARRPDDDPLKLPTQRWALLLTDRRVNHKWHTLAAWQRYSQVHMVDVPAKRPSTKSDMLLAALGPEFTRAEWLRRLFEVTPEHSRTLGMCWQRRAELVRRLKLGNLDDFELPNSRSVEFATRFLDTTEDMVSEFPVRDMASLIGLTLGSDLQGGWPSKITEANLAEWFRDSSLLTDLPLRTGTLPGLFGLSSFLRALGCLGRAFRSAAGSTQQPFVVTHDPHGLEASRDAALFAGLLGLPSFLRLRLDQSKDDIASTRRVFARLVLFATRWAAFKVTLRPMAIESPDELARSFEEASHRVLGFPLPQGCAFVLPRLNEDDAQRFLGTVLAFPRLEQLREEHNEDWFRNPRAVDQLRSEAQLSPNTTVSDEDVESALNATRNALYAVLGS